MPRIEESVEIDAPGDVVYAMLADYESYPEWVPECDRVEVDGDRVTFFVEVVWEVSLAVRVTEDPRQGIAWELADEHELVEHYEGTWTVEPRGERGCVARLSVDAKPGVPVPDAIVEKVMQFHLPRFLARVREHAEGLPAPT